MVFRLFFKKKQLTIVFYESQNFILCVSVLQFHPVFTHVCFSYINLLPPFVAVFSLNSGELGLALSQSEGGAAAATRSR